MIDDERRDLYKAATEFNFANPPGSPVLAWPGRRGGEPLRTRTRGGAWVLPSGEPVVRVDGYPGGIAITHIEPDPTRQPAVPDIEFETPPCPICSLGLDSDGDAFVCYPCRASWDMNGTGGLWDDPAAPRCKASVNPYPSLDPEAVEYCVLSRGHDLEVRTEHRSCGGGLTSWTDSSRIALTDGSGEPL